MRRKNELPKSFKTLPPYSALHLLAHVSPRAEVENSPRVATNTLIHTGSAENRTLLGPPQSTALQSKSDPLGAGKVAQQSEAQSAFAKDPSSVPSTQVKRSIPPVSPAARRSSPSSLYRHPHSHHTPTHGHKHKHKHTHTLD